MTPTWRSCVPAVVLLLVNLSSTTAWSQEAPPKLQIVIVEGDGAINNIKQRVNREPIVQVEDENHKPIAGAVVVFFLPSDGASGTFSNGARMLTVNTDAQGRAVARGFRPNNVSGQLQMRVTATFQGQTASSVIAQTNEAGAAGASSGGLSVTAKVLIILAVAGGAAAGAAIAINHTSASTPPPIPVPIIINAGTPTVGGPK